MLEIFDKSRKRIAIAENARGVEEERKINSLWYLTFSLPYNDAKNEYCQPFNYVRYNGGELYRIMPVDAEIAETGLLTYQCEHVLATLIDNVLFGYHVVGNRGTYTADCIRYVLNRQRVQNWVLYECDFARQFEYGWTQETLLSALFSIATPLADYMWVTDTSVYPWRLSLKSIGLGQKPQLYVRSGWNMLSYGSGSDPQQICTRLYPLGYGEGVNQLTIKSVNNGLEYIQSPQEYIDKYGLIERIWIDRRYEDPASLLSAAQVMLNELQDPLQQFEISFAELDESDYNVAQIGKRVRICRLSSERRSIPMLPSSPINTTTYQAARSSSRIRALILRPASPIWLTGSESSRHTLRAQRSFTRSRSKLTATRRVARSWTSTFPRICESSIRSSRRSASAASAPTPRRRRPPSLRLSPRRLLRKRPIQAPRAAALPRPPLRVAARRRARRRSSPQTSCRAKQVGRPCTIMVFLAARGSRRPVTAKPLMAMRPLYGLARMSIPRIRIRSTITRTAFAFQVILTTSRFLGIAIISRFPRMSTTSRLASTSMAARNSSTSTLTARKDDDRLD